jgi:hypothetical protein
VSNPALKAVSRIHLHRVATPAPRTLGRADALLYTLADTDARIGCAYRLLLADAEDMARIDRPAFVARANALLFDLELATQLVTALIPLKPLEEWLRGRERSIADQRRAIESLIRKAKAQ